MTTKLVGGPLGFRVLILARAPVYLRIVVDPDGNVDGLDQIADVPADGERIIVYRKVSDDGGCFIDYVDKKLGRRGTYCASASYVWMDPQPEDALVREKEAWQQWATAQLLIDRRIRPTEASAPKKEESVEASKCRSCGANILWVQSAKSESLMPLDAIPVADGNIAIVDGKAVVLSGDLFEEMVSGPRYQSHFASCPNAAKHRKQK